MSNLWSYLFTGLPADASEQSRRAHMIAGYGSLAVVVMVMVLATVPSWPLAVGVVAACICLGYLARLILGAGSGNGP